MKRIIHWLAHRLGWNYGNVETWWAGNRLMVGFRCNCGRLDGAHQAGEWKPDPEPITPEQIQLRALYARENPNSPEAHELNQERTRATEEALKRILPKCQPITKGTK